MWPFGSSSPSAAAPPPAPSIAPTETPPASTPPPPPTPAVAAPPPPTSLGRPPAPGLSSPSAELAEQDAEANEHLPAGTLPVTVSALDSTAMLIVAAGVAVATAGPSFFRMPVKSPQRAGVVLGTWTLTTYALVAHLSEKFKQQEFQQWEAKRLANPEAAALPSAPLQDVGFEGGFGGQEGLRDKHATTSGEH